MYNPQNQMAGAPGQSAMNAGYQAGSAAYNPGMTNYTTYQSQQYMQRANPQQTMGAATNQPAQGAMPVQQSAQQIRPPNPNVQKSQILAPYIPAVKPMQTPTGQNYYLLPAEEIQKMLQQNANIIRKFITDVNSGKLIDVTEYSGLHTSVYLLSLFTKSKDGNPSKVSVPVSTYQTLIKKMRQVEYQAQQQQQQQQQLSRVC